MDKLAVVPPKSRNERKCLACDKEAYWTGEYLHMPDTIWDVNGMHRNMGTERVEYYAYCIDHQEKLPIKSG